LLPVLFAACLGVACTSDARRVEVHLERGDAARAAGDYAAAALEYRSALEYEPARSEAHYGLALALLDLGQVDGAVWELRETVRLDPTNLEARLRFAWLALAAEETEEALTQARAIVEQDPDHLEGRLVLVAALLVTNDFDPAAEEAERIRERWPDENRALYNLARARAGQGRFDDAERLLLEFRQGTGNSLEATREVLRFYDSTGRREQAERFLRDAVATTAPADRPEFALALADRLDRASRDAEGEEPLRLALEAAPDRLDVRERLARLLARTGRLDEALALVAVTDPADAGAAVRLRIHGDLLAGVGRFEEALADYRGALRFDPESTPLRLREAECLMRLGDLAAGSERMAALLTSQPDDPILALAQARSLAMSERMDDAIEMLRGLVHRQPDLVTAQFLLGVLELAKGRPAEAIAPLEKAAAAETGARARQTQRLLADAYLRTGSFQAAVARADPLLADDPDDQRVRLILANAWLGEGATTRAESILLAAPRQDAALHGALARVYLHDGRLDEALAALEDALRLEPDSPRLLADLIWVLLRQGQTQQALERVRVGMLEHPDVADYPNLLGQLFNRQGDVPAAQRAFRRAIEVDPEFVDAYVNLAQVEAGQGRFDTAAELLHSALKREPENAGLLHELGVLEYRRGNLEAAIAAFEQSLSLEPGSAKTRAALSRALADVGRDLTRALEIARAARQNDPTDPGIADALGRVLSRSGLHVAALEQFRAAIELAPHPIAAYHYRLGRELSATGDPVGAATEMERALEIDETFEGSDDARRRLHQLRGEAGPTSEGPPPPA
jgi:putative PEP-CTERM system TPR-repeat lipoprotein